MCRIFKPGRCNITNHCSVDQIIKKTVSNGKFLYTALNSFNSVDLINFFETRNVPLKSEEAGRVFPKSDKAHDVLNALQYELKKHDIDIRFNCTVKDILIKKNKIEGILLEQGTIVNTSKLIIATGGASYPQTGSTGDGYNFAVKLGHTINTIRPALCSIITKEIWVKDLMGISLDSIKISFNIDHKKKIISQGPLVFTHQGISGPSVLELSSYLNKSSINSGSKIFIDFLPNIALEYLQNIFTESSNKKNNRSIVHTLSELIPKNLSIKVCELLDIDKNMPLNQIKRNLRMNLIQSLKNFELTFVKIDDIKKAIVTSGGICVSEINPKTMESKIVKGLYFAGEIIDVDALTGGYNLQIAFSTGYTAGFNV